MPRYWIRWYEPVDDSEDYRPRKWPPAAPVIAFWSTGWTCPAELVGTFGDREAYDDNDQEQVIRPVPPMRHVTLCALVECMSVALAKQAILDSGWDPVCWSFVDKKPDGWRPHEERFPWPEWAGEKR